MPSFEPDPKTGDELAVKWATRDAEYAKLRTPMDYETVEAIRAQRKREAGMLPAVADRARMWARAEVWQPPKHDEFGGLEDWLS